MNGPPIPRKTREFQNHHFDSTIWNDFRFRDDDIIIATYAKSGTTWVQQIIAQLLFNGEENWESILLHCSFDYMKANATKSVPLGGAFWDGGAQSFIHKGTNGRWRDILEKDESLKYEVRATEELGEECAHWLATGEMS